MRLKTFISVALMSYAINSMAALETEADKLSYSLGARMAEQVKPFNNINPEALAQGIQDVLGEQETLIPAEEIQQTIQLAYSDLEKQRQQKLDQEATASLNRGEAFLIENGKKPGITSLKSGLQYRVIKEGSGPTPVKTDRVVVHYEGRLLDGSVFDSSWERNEPAAFQLNQVIPGWTEGLQKMPQGSVWELYIPSSLAYGSVGIPGRIGPNEVLTFKVELREVKK